MMVALSSAVSTASTAPAIPACRARVVSLMAAGPDMSTTDTLSTEVPANTARCSPSLNRAARATSGSASSPSSGKPSSRAVSVSGVKIATGWARCSMRISEPTGGQ